MRRGERGEIDGRQETELCRFNWPHFIVVSCFHKVAMNRLIKVNRFSLLLGQELKVSLLFFLGTHVAILNINCFLPQ